MRYKKPLVITTIVSLIMLSLGISIPVVSAETELITNPGFETGDLTGWTINHGSPLVGTDYARSGTYGCKFYLNTDGVGYGDCITQSDADWSGVSPIKLSFYFWMTSLLTGNDNLQILEVENSDFDRLIAATIFVADAVNNLSISNGLGDYHSFSFNPMMWTFVEIVYTDNSTLIELRVNDVTATIDPAYYPGGIYKIFIGALFTGGQPGLASKEIWFDDVSLTAFLTLNVMCEPELSINFKANENAYQTPQSLSLTSGTYTITALDMFTVVNGTRYAFVQWTVNGTISYYESAITLTITGNTNLTAYYFLGGFRRKPVITPTPEEVAMKACFPLTFYIVMVLITFVGLYLYAKREMWKISVPLILVIAWLLWLRPCPLWGSYIVTALTVIVGGLLVNKLRGK